MDGMDTNQLELQRKQQASDIGMQPIQQAQEMQREQLYQQLQAMNSYQEEMDSRAMYQEKLAEMKDTAKLGHRSIKGEKAVRQAKNERIKNGRRLTSKATAYTEEIYRQLQEINALNENQKENEAGKAEERLRGLELYRFTPQMFISSNIRANFKEYIMLIQDYQYLTEQKQEESGVPQLSDRIAAISGTMELLKLRLQVYCEQNRVSLSGGILEDKKQPAQITREQLNQWYDTVADLAVEKQQQYEAGIHQLEVREINRQLQQDKDSPDETDTAIDEPEALTIEQRILSVDKLKQNYEHIRELRQEVEADSEGEAEELAMLRQAEQRYGAYYLLATQEAEYVSRKANGEDVTELMQKNKELQEDIQRLEHRRIRQELGLRQNGGAEAAATTVRRSRLEAITTYSDRLSYQSRDELMKLCQALKATGEAPQVQKAVEQYLTGTRYQVGYTEERKRLKAAMQAVSRALQKEQEGTAGAAALENIQQYFAKMTNGTLVIPEGAKIRDFSGKRPKETGKGSKGSTRNALIRGVSYWSNQKDTPLFSHEPVINDLKQRLVSNCYMMASVAGLVDYNPDLLKNCMIDEGETVVVRLYEWQKVETEKDAQTDTLDGFEELEDLEQVQKQNEPETADGMEDMDGAEDMNGFEELEVEKIELRPIYVRVSKEIPRIAGADALSSGALWMQMIEKACAFVGKEKVSGYQSLWYGEVGKFLERLTGISTEPVNTEDKDALFEELCTARQRGYVYNAGSDNTAGSDDGLNGGHAYTVMGAEEIQGEKYVLMRNPYSTYSLRYEQDGSKSRTGDLLNVSSDETYGQFYMKIDDFVNKFHTVTKTQLSRL